MYVNITGSANNKDVYIYQSYRKENGKTSSRIYRKLGKLNDLLARFDGDKDKMMAWAKEEAAKDTAAYNKQKENVSVEFSPMTRIPLDEERSFNAGYLFLQKLCSELRIDNICRNIRNRHKFTYDLHAILTDLIYARILSPSSKMSSYSFCGTLLEPPKYSLQNKMCIRDSFGITSRDAKEVCLLPDESKGEILTIRWTPFSFFRYP